MRPFVLSLLLLSTAWAQTSSSSGIAYGQTYKNFNLPYYDNGQLKYTLTASQATGMSLNRAETIDMRIDIYENGKVTTTITSPKADLYSSERRLRTKDKVRIDRADMTATAQRCDFDLLSKQYILRDNVRVILKNFDASAGLGPSAKHSSAPPSSIRPLPSAPTPRDDALLESPGAYSNTTNVGPISPAPPGSK